jgi:hypothetical protein
LVGEPAAPALRQCPVRVFSMPEPAAGKEWRIEKNVMAAKPTFLSLIERASA